MLLYITLGTNDLARAKPFYDAVLGTLGYVCQSADDSDIGYAAEGDTRCRLWVVRPYDRNPATIGNGSMVALVAKTRAEVDEFHSIGLAHGGIDEGAPGLRPFGDNFYAAYVRDLDGNKLSAVCETPQ